MEAVGTGQSETTRLTTACHCGATRYSFDVPTASLPLSAYLCHCNISRRISGLLCTSYVPVPAANPPPTAARLTAYKSSDILQRLFCSTCGTHLFLEYAADGHFEVSTGTVSRADGPGGSDGLVRFDGSMWVEDTRDGGASVWFRSLSGRPVERWLVAPHKSVEVPLDWTDRAPGGADATAAVQRSEDRLRARCHCGSVEFSISRPDGGDHTAADGSGPAEKQDDAPPWRSQDGKRYAAGTCACGSCRGTSGFDFNPWISVPVGNIVLPSGDVFRGQPFGTAIAYRSSPAAVRWFCARCGASVFWIAGETPKTFDVAVGLLDALSGARAEEWLDWAADGTEFEDEAHNKALIGAMREGLVEWTKMLG